MRAPTIKLWHDRRMQGGSYSADRAAALSGVPLSTVHHWARKGIVVPSVSPERVRLWSYGDLLALRTVYWLRQRKELKPGHEIPASTMHQVRRALAALARFELPVVDQGRARVFVKSDGQIVLDGPAGLRDADGQYLLSDVLDLIAPFPTTQSTRGIDLVEPAPNVRITPKRLAGAPHVLGTRIDTEGLAALHRRGLNVSSIRALYPDLSTAAIDDALSVERQLEQNLAA